MAFSGMYLCDEVYPTWLFSTTEMGIILNQYKSISDLDLVK